MNAPNTATPALSPPPPRLRFKWPRAQRLRTAAEFSQSKAGRRFRQGVLSLTRYLVPPTHAAPDQTLAPIRLGLIISRKAMRRAHERNRAKRLIREHVRLHYHECVARIGANRTGFHGEYWVVVVGRNETDELLRQAFITLMTQLKPLPLRTAPAANSTSP